jgi:hypothetical protein
MAPQPGQPSGRRGTVGHAYSALNLRLIFAGFGTVACAVLAVVLAWAGQPVGALVMAALALAGAVDLGVVLHRLRERRRRDPHHRYSLFE